MSIVIHSAMTLGLQVIPITIEAALGHGFSGLQLLGLPSDYARDAKERIRASLERLGIALPARRLLVSVRPSESLKQFKTGLEHLDLPCALAVLVALADQQNAPKLMHGSLRTLSVKLAKQPFYFAGQLTLSGELLPLENTLSFEILSLQKAGHTSTFWCRLRTDKPISRHASICFQNITSLHECINLLMHPAAPASQESSESSDAICSVGTPSSSDEVSTCEPHASKTRVSRICATLEKFQHCPSVALALSIAAAGRHHILLAGSPGCGKTFSLRNLKHLLPPLSSHEKIETALIQNRDSFEIRERPFRSPHHSASSAALLGGSLLQPGEVSLAHHGVLFLDEFAEFPRPTLEALREPLDERKISLSRARGRVELPANFMLLAATNPCACGYVFSRTVQCRCQVGAPIKYQQKLSGPLLERFSILLLMDSLTQHNVLQSRESDDDKLPLVRTLSEDWLSTVQTHPEQWADHFIAIQMEFWQQSKPLNLSAELHKLICERSHRRNWSARRRLRITELLLTCQKLFAEQFTLNLNSHQFIDFAEELRSLETTLQKGVYLLTPAPTPPLLKTHQQSHDTLINTLGG